MKAIKRFSALLIFGLGILFVLDINKPGTLSKIQKAKLIAPIIKKANALISSQKKKMAQVLGEKTNTQAKVTLPGAKEIEALSGQFLETEAGIKLQQSLNSAVNQATEKIQTLPESQMKVIQKEIKKQICKEILEDE